MKIRDSVTFVTGANRGIGLVFAQELLAAGARKVYATAQNPERITLDGVNRVSLDVTKRDAVAIAAFVLRHLFHFCRNRRRTGWSRFLHETLGRSERRARRRRITNQLVAVEPTRVCAASGCSDN